MLALVIMALYAALWQDAPILAPDSQGYLEVARDLSDLKLDQLHDRVVGYPLVLTLTGSADTPRRVLFLVQMTLHLTAILFLVHVARCCGVTQRRSWVLALLGVLPSSMASAVYVLSEVTCEFTLAIAVGSLVFWLLGRGGMWLGLAVLFTCAAALTRPTYQLLGLAFGLALLPCIRVFFRRRRVLLLGAAALALGSTVLTIAEIGFNARSFGFAGLTPLFGFNLSTRTQRYVERLPNDEAEIRRILIEHRDRALVAPDGDHTGSMYIWKAIPDLQAATGLSRAELSRKMTRLNLGLIASAPLNYMSEVVRAWATYWLPPTPILAHSGSRWFQLLWGVLGLGILFLFGIQLVAFLGLLWVLRFGPPRGEVLQRPEIRPLLAGLVVSLSVILYTSVISSLFETGNPRYRTPTDALIWLFVLLGFELWRRLRVPTTQQGEARSGSLRVVSN